MNEIQKLQELAGIKTKLTEGVQAVPGVGGGHSFAPGDKVNPSWSPNGLPMEVQKILPSGKAVVKDEWGNIGTIPVESLVPAPVHEEIGSGEIETAQQEIDFDTGSQAFEEDIEKPAQVVSCNQDNPASCRDACAMEESMEDDKEVQEAYDLNNGYYDRKELDGEDYFPTGADGPVVDKVGPSGARQGDNPEQKKMEIAETHKELVYSYRAFLKESASKK